MVKQLFLFLFASAASIGSAQVIWDNTALWTATSIRNAQEGPALGITNTTASNINLNFVAFQGENDTAQTFDFYLIKLDSNHDGTQISSVFVSEGVSGPHSLFGAQVNWTLDAGVSYYIGAQTSVAGADYDYEFPTFHLINGLQGVHNNNYAGYPVTTTSYQEGGQGTAEMSWQLDGSAAPEPESLTAFALGLAVLAMRRRKVMVLTRGEGGNQ